MANERQGPEQPSIKEMVKVERRGPSSLTIILAKTQIHIDHFRSELEQFAFEEARCDMVKNVDEDVQKVNLERGYILFSANVETATLENPFKMSPDSDAKYLARLQTPEFLFLYQYLDGQTSRHMHPNEWELFVPQRERNPSFVNNSKVEIINGPLWLPPDTYHEAFSHKEPTLTAIVQASTVTHAHDPQGKTSRDVLHSRLNELLAQRA